MPHLNVCSFMGHAGRNAELKQSKDGSTSWAEFTLAVSTGTQDKPKTLWVKCRVFGKGAMRAVEKVNKGDAVYVSGKIDANAYARKQDNVPTVDLSLLVNDWQWIKPSSKSEALPEDLKMASTVPSGQLDDFNLPF